MKKVLLVLGLVTMFSCQKEEIKTNEQSNQETQQDCNCDRVVAVKKFYIVGDAQSSDPSGTYHCPITTINDCSEIQKDRSFNFKNEYSIPKVGECYDMGY
jgi:hypothetical protein